MTSAEKTEKTLRADARRNREKIFAASRELFARDAEGVQMEEIASHAGVGVGTIYRHFPTKQALLTEMVRTRFSRFTEIALEAERIDDPREAVETLIRQSCVE
ncbi:MAG TPA: helix-turn-helix domain-containing protein, partial [Solirubrobacterales bacterium]|nr:helix-turn-helix domain-containing protein [Solirubrobacterales bacterium]